MSGAPDSMSGMTVEDAPVRRRKAIAPHIYRSRYTPGLGPGDGELTGFDVGETTRVVDGQDMGRMFVVTSDRMRHDEAGGYVREGYFVDDPDRTRWARDEGALWHIDLP